MATYYIDPLRGSELGDGLSPLTSKQSIKDIAIQPGDTIRFACDRMYRESLRLVGGTADAPATYTSYGDGPWDIISSCGASIRPPRAVV